MLVSEITLQALVDQIKVEGRIKGADNLDLTIVSIINELLLTYSEDQRYSDLIVKDHPIVLVAGQTAYELPLDFANIKKVYYTREGFADRRVLNNKGDFVEFSRDGVEPKYYELASGELYLFPFAGITTNDTCTIDYWRMPTMLAMADKFPLPKLLPVIKQKAIARVLKYNKDYNGSDRFDGTAKEVASESQTDEDNSDS